MIKFISLFWALSIPTLGFVLFERKAPELLERQAPSIISSVLESRQIDTSNSSDWIDPSASFLDDVPVSEGGDGSNASTPDSYLSSRQVKRAGVTGHGSEYVSFTNDTNHFNLTIAKCATAWSQVVGRWTFFNQSTSNYVTWVDIYRDVCAHAGIPGNGGRQLQTEAYGVALNEALMINAQETIKEVSAFIDSTITNLSTTVPCPNTLFNSHTELRRLLELPDNYWTFVFVGASVTGVVNTGLWYSAFGANATAWQIAEIGVSTAVLVLASGIVGWIANLPRTANLDRQVVSGANSAGRQTINAVSQAASAGRGMVQSASHQALNTLGGSTQSLLQMGANVNHEPGQSAVGGGELTAGTTNDNLGIPGGQSTVCLTQVAVEGGIAGVSNLEAAEAGLSSFAGVTGKIVQRANSGGSCSS